MTHLEKPMSRYMLALLVVGIGLGLTGGCGLFYAGCSGAVHYGNGGPLAEAVGLGLSSGLSVFAVGLIATLGFSFVVLLVPHPLSKAWAEAGRVPVAPRATSFLRLQGSGVILCAFAGGFLGLCAWFERGWAAGVYAFGSSLLSGGLFGLAFGLVLAACCHYLPPLLLRRTRTPLGDPS